MVVDKDDNCGLSANNLNGIQISKCINLNQPSILPHTRAGPPIPNLFPNFTLQLSPSTFTPLVQEGIIILVAPTARILVTLPRAIGPAINTKYTLSGIMNPVLPLSPSCRLEATCIGNNTLDTCSAATVKGSGRQPQSSIICRDKHSGVNLGVAKSVFLGLVLVVVVVVLVAVLWVGGVAVLLACDESVELILGGGGGHGGRDIDVYVS